jgi:PhoD-like phosphatase
MEHVCADPARLRELYRVQKEVPGYKKLLAQNVTIFGTFDGTYEWKYELPFFLQTMRNSIPCLIRCSFPTSDHDYGCNNADKTFEHRYESGLEYINFLGQAIDSPMSRRAQAGLGVYGVKLFDFSRRKGDEEVPDDEALIDPDTMASGNGTAFPTYSNRTVAIFVLDVRSNKSPWKQGSAAYIPDHEGDMLGEQQWQWFEAAIARSQAAVNVVVSGLQHHANIFPNPNIAESWSKFPTAQQRLFDAMLQEGVQAPILVSGDVHMTELARKDCERIDGTSFQRRSLVELTTSGMTHSWGTLPSPPRSNPLQKPSVRQRYESFVSSTVMEVLHSVSPWTDLLMSRSQPVDGLHPNGGGDGARQGLQYSLEKNFGELAFDWEQRTVSMRSMGENPEAPPLLMASWTMDQLSGYDTIPGGLLTSQDFATQASLRHAALGGEWICLSHRGTPSFLWQMVGHVAAAASFTALLPFPLLVPTCIIASILLRRKQKQRGLLSSEYRQI